MSKLSSIASGYSKEENAILKKLYIDENKIVQEVVDELNRTFWSGQEVRTFQGVESKLKRLKLLKKPNRSNYESAKISDLQKKIYEMKKTKSYNEIAKELGKSINTIKSTFLHFKAQIKRRKHLLLDAGMITEDEQERVESVTKEVLFNKIAMLEKDLNHAKAVNTIIVDTVKAIVPRLPKIAAPNFIIRKGVHKEETAMLEFGDTHVGEKCVKEDMANISEYNFDIFKERMDTLFHGIAECIDIQRSKIPIKTLDINMLGDFVTGEDIYLGQARSIDMPLIEQTMQAANMIEQKLITPATKLFSKVRLRCVFGNHGRIGKPGQFHVKSNFDYIIYQFLNERYKNNPRVELYISECPFMLYQLQEAPNFTHLISHGGEVNSWMCFVPDSPVVMSNYTSKPICEVIVGDKVITTNGIKSVKNAYIYKYDGNIVNINAKLLPKNTWKVTPNHEVMVLRYEDTLLQSKESYLQFVGAGSIRENDFIAIPKPKFNNTKYELISSDYHSKLPNPPHPNEKMIPEKIKINKDLGLICGLYLADGSIYGKNDKVKGNNHNCTIEIDLGKHEKSFADLFIKAYVNVFGYEPQCVPTKHNIIRIIHRCQRITSIIEQICGKGLRTKILNDEVFTWPKEVLESILIGYLMGDGDTRTRLWNKLTFTHAVSVTSVSEKLIQQMYWISLYLGYTPAIKYYEKPNYGKFAKLSFYGNDARILSRYITEGYSNINDTNIRKNDPYNSLETENYILVKVESVVFEEYCGLVHDIHIEDINNYLVNMTVVHNSIPFYGIQRDHAKYMSMTGININYWHLAHFHNAAKIDIPNGEHIVNGCFLPSQNVVMFNGILKRFDEIQSNDKIINIEGKISNVNEVIKRQHKGNMIKMSISGIPDRNAIHCTPNHEIYAIKGSQLAYNNTSRGNLDSDVPTGVVLTPKWISAEYLSPGDYVIAPKIKSIGKLEHDCDFYKLLGLFAAEGSISGVKVHGERKMHHADFTFNIKEKDLSSFVVTTVKKYFNYDPTENERPDKTTRSVVINNSEICKQLYDYVGKGCSTKILKSELMLLPLEVKEELLVGWLLGDGCESNTDGSFTVMGATVSKALAWQMRQISIDIGLSPKMCMRMIPEHQPVYCLAFSNMDAVYLDTLMHNRFETAPVQECLIDSFTYDNQLYIKIKRISTYNYNGDVYDLSVESETENGHSYIVQGVGVHNSFVGGSELSVFRMKTKSQPKQLFFGFSRSRGITWRYDLQLSDVTKDNLTVDSNGIYTPTYKNKI